jgi:prepilin-type N-terminal cleavage/methylation domain-containing protein
MRARGVTLIELLLVVSLLALLALLSWPDFESAAQSEQLAESARRIRALVAMCRAEAMNEARRVRITIRLDGSLKLRQQLDPVRWPQVYIPIQKDWARVPALLEDVWVEAVALLPDGPPPVLVEDEIRQFEDMEEQFEPVPIEQFERPIDVVFQPDGTSTSLRFVLRDTTGRGLVLTLDGRVGRLAVEWVPRLDPQEVERPPAVDLAAEAEEEERLWSEAGWSPSS